MPESLSIYYYVCLTAILRGNDHKNEPNALASGNGRENVTPRAPAASAVGSHLQ